VVLKETDGTFCHFCLIPAEDGMKPVLSLSNQAQFLLVNKSSAQWLSDQIDPDQCDCSKVHDNNKL